MSDEDKVRENRLRRAAQRQGLVLKKSRRRDPCATDFGTYMLVDQDNNVVVANSGDGFYGMSLEDVDKSLSLTLWRGQQAAYPV